MYNGFELDILAEKITKPIKIIDKLVDSIFGENSNYFYSWLNHIITKPHIKTNHAIVLYSRQHGVGKNSIIELIRVILGDKYCSKFKTIDDLLKQFNSHHANKFFIFGDEIKPRASDLAADLKNAITETQKNVEKKGIDPEVIKDCANYLFTTNDEIAFKIEEDDRRFFCVEIEECKLTKNDFEEFRKVLDDKKEMAKMFSFIKNYENPVKIVGERPPMTPYKSRLMAFSLHSVSSFLYKKIDSYCADEDEEKIREIKSLTLYDMVVKYAKESRLHAGFSPKYFGNVMKKLIDVSEGKIYKKHTISGSVYCFPNKKEVLTVLKKYSKDIYIALGCDELEGVTVD
jgi:hypothetical protein